MKYLYKMETSTDWRRKSKAERMKYMMNNSLWSDCSFLVGKEYEQKEFKAHKNLLALASPVFEAMFYGAIAEKSDAIMVEDITVNGFELLLQFVYTDAVNIGNIHDAANVSYAARKYLMSDLEERSMKKIQEFLSPETACHAYEIATFLDNSALADAALKVISSKSKDVLKSPEIEKVQLSTLEMILDQDSLAIDSELDLFHAISRWAKSECRRQGRGEEGEFLRAVADPLLCKVRFLTLQPQQLAQGPAASALLSREESYALFMNVSAPEDCPVPLPRGFSDSTDNRSVTHRAISAKVFFRCLVPIAEFTIITFEGRKGIYISGLKLKISFGSSSSTLNSNLWMWESSGALDGERTLVVQEKWTGMSGSGIMPVVCYFKSRYSVKENFKYVILVLISPRNFSAGIEGTVEYEKAFAGTLGSSLLQRKNEFEIFVSKNQTVQSIIAFPA